MIANHIHDALAQVRTLKGLVLEKALFRGYSGYARIGCGTLALFGALVMSSAVFPDTPTAHLVGWGVVLALALAFNYGALAHWFLFDREVRRDLRQLKPAIDALPALGVGAILSIAIIAAGTLDLLCGVWICLYGLAQCAYRQSLPRHIYTIGVAYIVAGAACLLWPGASFLNPWPMGVAFFSGEWAGGLVLLTDRDLRAQELTEAEKE